MSERADRAGPGGVKPTEAPLDAETGDAERVARPPSGADDGKTGGQTQGGKVGTPTRSTGGSDASNAQRGGPSGVETDRDAPGAATHKKSDDVR